jgi:tetratricopeptide (TPR) repeat protein
MPRVSLTMIVRNEEADLPRCLESVADLVDEIVIVDTGSTDGTKGVAARFGPKVKLFDFPWCDNFAAARNESLRHATGDWALWLDADDRLDEVNRQRLKNLLTTLPEAKDSDDLAVYLMQCLNVSSAESAGATALEHGRLFRLDPRVRWQYRVHEQIVPAIERLGGRTLRCDVAIHHYGYVDGAQRRQKLVRDLRLLELDQAERPDDPLTLFHLGWTQHLLGQSAAAADTLERCRQVAPPQLAIVRRLYALLVRSLRELGRRDEALAICGAGRAGYPDDAELLFHEGQLFTERGDFAAAEAALLRLVQLPPDGPMASGEDPGIRGHKGRCVLAEVYRGGGRLAEAEAQWRAAITLQPDYVVPWLCLGDLYFAQGRWSDAERLAGELESERGRPLDALLLRARAHMTRREFGEARRLAEEAVAQAPDALMPREILSHVLVLEGRDWAAAEAAVREVLARQPNNPTARTNLAVVMRQRQAAQQSPAQQSSGQQNAGQQQPPWGGSIIVG